MCFQGIKFVVQQERWNFIWKRRLAEKLPPYQGGGEMIKEVTFEKTTYAELPHKFEAGTPNIAGGIVLGTAIDYMNQIGFDNIQIQEKELLEYGTKRLLEIEGLKIYGPLLKIKHR
jgi:cysteine desulfurase / selenocysteine lyase